MPDNTEFTDGDIEGVLLVELQQHNDERGSLIELFRSDEIPNHQTPVMGYLSATNPGIQRGPHEHEHQTDHFVITGPGEFEFCLWDDRLSSETSGKRMIIRAGAKRPMRITVPPGVVHAYRNNSDQPAHLLNFPDKLYAGEGRTKPVDEHRWESVEDELHPFHW